MHSPTIKIICSPLSYKEVPQFPDLSLPSCAHYMSSCILFSMLYGSATWLFAIYFHGALSLLKHPLMLRGPAVVLWVLWNVESVYLFYSKFTEILFVYFVPCAVNLVSHVTHMSPIWSAAVQADGKEREQHIHWKLPVVWAVRQSPALEP
jgi:hypothetical protein